MLDAPARRLLAPTLDRVAGLLERLGVAPLAVTGLGWLVGIGACVAAGTGQWTLALVLWLANRLLDGLDGPVARRRGATDLGGYLDLLADFSVYAGFVVAVGLERPEAQVACLALLAAYYVNAASFLALGPLLERHRPGGAGAAEVGDGRSVRFVPGLAEGTETVLAYAAICLLPEHAATIAWVFAALVAASAVQRVVLGIRGLGPRRTPAEPQPNDPANDPPVDPPVDPPNSQEPR